MICEVGILWLYLERASATQLASLNECVHLNVWKCEMSFLIVPVELWCSIAGSLFRKSSSPPAMNQPLTLFLCNPTPIPSTNQNRLLRFMPCYLYLIQGEYLMSSAIYLFDLSRYLHLQFFLSFLEQCHLY